MFERLLNKNNNKVSEFLVNLNLNHKEEETIKFGEKVTSPSFEDLVYNDRQKEFMEMVLKKIKNGENLNLLFSGYAGTGKTYSTKMIAKETDKNYVYLNGGFSPKKITHILTNLKENTLVVFDEIHNIPEKVAEVIYPAIEYGCVGIGGKEIKLNNPMFIGTTTEPSKLPKPLQDRFFRIEFEEPTSEQIALILSKRGIGQEIINKLVNYTQNIRIINKLIKMIKMYGEVNIENMIKVFRIMKINLYSGTSDEQEQYINYLKTHKRGSLKILSLVLRRSEGYIRDDIEPDLIRKGIVMITSKGRELSPDIQQYESLEKEAKNVRFTQQDREFAIGWLKDRHQITEKLGKRYFELVNTIAEMIHEGSIPDEIDFESFGVDKSIKDSIKDNYITEL